MAKLLRKRIILRASLFGLLALVSSCAKRPAGNHLPGTDRRGMRFEATSASMAQSQKDGVFLMNCQLQPGTVRGGNDFLLDVEEVFIEQRFSVGEYTDQARLLDSTVLRPKLVIIPKKNSRLSRMGVDAFVEMRAAPYTRASSTNNNIIILELVKPQLSSPFALRLHVPNPQGVAEDVNLTVWPQPLTQTLEEAYNSASGQSRQDGVLLATCAVQPVVGAQDSVRFQVQEAFIENRFVLSSRTQELHLLDSAHTQPRLVLVGSPNSRLGLAGSTWEMTLADGQRPVHYREKEKLFVFNLTESQSRKEVVLRLRICTLQGRYTEHQLRVLPTAVQPGSGLSASLAPSAPAPKYNGVFEEMTAVFNSSSEESRRRGMALTSYRAMPAVVTVGGQFRLEIGQAFSERHALITQISKRIELDSTYVVGPRLVIVCQTTSKLGRLGIDWDLRLKTGGQTLAYQVKQQPQLLLFHLDSRYVAEPLMLSLTVKDQLGKWEERLIELRPAEVRK